MGGDGFWYQLIMEILADAGDHHTSNASLQVEW
jgi:hypothetical protein